MAQKYAKSFYDSKEWKAVRQYCLTRDHFMCVRCGAVAEEVHHIVHISEDNIGDVSITLNPNNLQSLCKECHFNEHKLDKLNGINQSKGIEEYEYKFDENGMLIRK